MDFDVAEAVFVVKDKCSCLEAAIVKVVVQSRILVLRH